MKHTSPTPAKQRGTTLAEAVIAISVLAVAIPLVFGTLLESGKCGLSSQAESRSIWMIPACMDEIHASRAGRPQYFPPTTTGQPFPPNDDVWALAFTRDGKAIGKLPRSLYEKGTRELEGRAVRYIATLKATTPAANNDSMPMLRVHITLEYPAASPAAKRRKLDFITRIP